MNRRTFAGTLSKALLAFVAFSSSVGMTGCNAVTDLENWIPVALSAVSAIVKLLGPVVPAPVAAIIVLIQAGFSALLTALKNYQAGTGVLADIANAYNDVVSAFASFFSSLNIPAALLSTIEGLGDILISTLEAFAAKIGVSTAAVSTKFTRSVPALYRSSSKFRSDWNAYAVSKGVPQAEI